MSLCEIYEDSVALVQFLIHFRTRGLHEIENIETPVKSMKAVQVLVATHIAHACFTSETDLESLDVGVLRLFVHLKMMREEVPGRWRCS